MLVGTCAALAIASAANAQNGTASQSFRELLDCKRILDDQQRLACYDRAVTIVTAATERQDIIVTDKREIRQARKKLFGFSLPDSPLLGQPDAEESSRLEAAIISARRNRDGGWIVQLAEGGTWEQIDSKALPLSPKTGQKVVVTRGALGSFFVSIDGQAALKMRRIQ